ncbi:MAG: hypothetical protein J6B29_05540 [Clostridia bacterium]|nr:hypothetical protein [Clostridia bacterium]
MAKEYKRIPLAIDALFLPDGSIKPKSVVTKDGIYPITRVLRVRSFCPTVVPCVAPTEYTVLIEGSEKKLYFEPHSNMWFSVKEVYKQ